MASETIGNIAPLRIAVSGVASGPSGRITGGLLCGEVTAGETVLFSPDNLPVTVNDVEQDGDILHLTLGQPVELSGPSLISRENDVPVQADVFLLDLDKPLDPQLFEANKLHVITACGAIEALVEPTGSDRQILVRCNKVVALDEFSALPQTGQCQVMLDDSVVAIGRVSMKGYADQRQLRTVRATNITRVAHRISAEDRIRKYGHTGGVLWLTGLSGSGKSTLAVELEKKLFNRGFMVYVLDGDNVRHGLNANLGFSPEDRSENIRRVGEVAALFARAGFIAISAFISPYRSDRERARAATEDFHEIFVSADLAVCEGRDPKGLYARARKGEIADFTGISAPYEAPEKPDLSLDTGGLTVEQSVDQILEYVMQNFQVNK